MNDDDHDDESAENEATLARAFEHLGATPQQARMMAAQLLKRARQLASERGTSVETTLAELLQKVVAGRHGTYTPDAPGSSSGDRAHGKSG